MIDMDDSRKLSPVEKQEQALALGAAEYKDILDGLARAGYRAEFTQTGGMCAAIEVNLEDGCIVLVTDADDTLSWQRANQQGWGVGLYPPPEDDDSEALDYLTTPDGDLRSLLVQLARVLGNDSAAPHDQA